LYTHVVPDRRTDRVDVRLNDEERAMLSAVTKSTGRTVSELFRQWLRQAFAAQRRRRAG